MTIIAELTLHLKSGKMCPVHGVHLKVLYKKRCDGENIIAPVKALIFGSRMFM